MPLHISATFRDVPSKIEGVIPEHRRVGYVYYDKMYHVQSTLRHLPCVALYN